MDSEELLTKAIRLTPVTLKRFRQAFIDSFDSGIWSVVVHFGARFKGKFPSLRDDEYKGSSLYFSPCHHSSCPACAL